jgi:stearoyl-CoA desaturase (Delta-9 desaturase)
LQNSVLVWCARHRRITALSMMSSAIRIRSVPASGMLTSAGCCATGRRAKSISDQVRDLEQDPLLRWQHRHYWLLTWLLNLGVPALLGLLVGEVIGMVLLAGAVRLVFSQHCTFFINSLAHCWGKRHYSHENTSRDNGWLALVTWGEGYHNFHHSLPGRLSQRPAGGISIPGKWLIALAHQLDWPGTQTYPDLQDPAGAGGDAVP